MDVRRIVELLVDLDERRVLAVAAPEAACALLADLREPLGLDGQADDLGLIDLEQRAGGSIPFTIGTFAVL